MQKLAITWLGHSTFIIRTPGGKRVLFDPWLGNPHCPDSMKKPKVDLILVSHGHFDHMEDLVTVARDTNAFVVGIFELCDWVGRKGIQNVSPMNKGGSQDILGLRVNTWVSGIVCVAGLVWFWLSQQRGRPPKKPAPTPGPTMAVPKSRVRSRG